MKSMRIILNEPQSLFIVAAIEAILITNREGATKNDVWMGIGNIERAVKELKERNPEVFEDMNKLQSYIIDRSMKWSRE